MRVLYPIVDVPISDMVCFRDYLTMGDWITSQFVSNDLSGFTLVTANQTLEEPLCRSSFTTGLQEYIYYFTVLVNCSPEVMQLPVDIDEDFINVKGFAVASVLSL